MDSQLKLKAYLLRQKDGSHMLVSIASRRWRWRPGEYSLVSLQHVILYETREYWPGHQCHLREANKTNIGPAFLTKLVRL